MHTARAAQQFIYGLAFVLAPNLHSAPIKAAGPAPVAMVDVTNMSDKQVWVTVYWSYAVTGWHIDRAFCLKQGARDFTTITYHTPELGPKIRVRAEVMEGDCRSKVYRDTDGKADIPTNWTPATPRVHSTILGNGGAYRVDVKPSML